MKKFKNFALVFLAFAMVVSSVLISSFKSSTNCNSKVFATTVNIASGEGWSYDDVDGEKTVTFTGQDVGRLTSFDRSNEVDVVVVDGGNFAGNDAEFDSYNMYKVVIDRLYGDNTYLNSSSSFMGCNNLREVWIYSEYAVVGLDTMPYLFYGLNQKITFYVPKNLVSDYETALSNQIIGSTMLDFEVLAIGSDEDEPEEGDTGVVASIILPTILAVTFGTVLAMYALTFKRKKRI